MFLANFDGRFSTGALIVWRKCSKKATPNKAVDRFSKSESRRPSPDRFVCKKRPASYANPISFRSYFDRTDIEFQENTSNINIERLIGGGEHTEKVSHIVAVQFHSYVLQLKTFGRRLKVSLFGVAQIIFTREVDEKVLWPVHRFYDNFRNVRSIRCQARLSSKVTENLVFLRLLWRNESFDTLKMVTCPFKKKRTEGGG